MLTIGLKRFTSENFVFLPLYSIFPGPHAATDAALKFAAKQIQFSANGGDGDDQDDYGEFEDEAARQAAVARLISKHGTAESAKLARKRSTAALGISSAAATRARSSVSFAGARSNSSSTASLALDSDAGAAEARRAQRRAKKAAKAQSKRDAEQARDERRLVKQMMRRQKRAEETNFDSDTERPKSSSSSSSSSSENDDGGDSDDSDSDASTGSSSNGSDDGNGNDRSNQKRSIRAPMQRMISIGGVEGSNKEVNDLMLFVFAPTQFDCVLSSRISFINLLSSISFSVCRLVDRANIMRTWLSAISVCHAGPASHAASRKEHWSHEESGARTRASVDRRQVLYA